MSSEHAVIASGGEPFSREPAPAFQGQPTNPCDAFGVKQFCDQHNMASVADNAVRLAERCFSPDSLVVYLSGDPAGDEQWIVVQANVRGTVEQVLEAYDHLQTEWLKSYAWQQRMMIRFIYNIL